MYAKAHTIMQIPGRKPGFLAALAAESLGDARGGIIISTNDAM